MTDCLLILSKFAVGLRIWSLDTLEPDTRVFRSLFQVISGRGGVRKLLSEGKERII